MKQDEITESTTRGQTSDAPRTQAQGPDGTISKMSTDAEAQTGRSSVIPSLVRTRIAFYRRTARIQLHLERHPERSLTLQEAASFACMERTAFSRFFHQRIGVTFSEFLRTFRIELAQKRMLATNASLKEIAHGVGFKSFATFERQFKKETGLCPSEFRSRELERIGVVEKANRKRNGRAGRIRQSDPTGVQAVRMAQR